MVRGKGAQEGEKGDWQMHWEEGEKGKIFHGFRWEEKELVSTGLWGVLEKGNRSHLKLSNTSQKQVLPSIVTWNSHLLISIWFYIVFLFFANPGIILLIGVDGKGHRLFYWDWLLTCLPRICLWSFPLARAHWKIMRCGFIWFLLCLFVIFLFSLFSTIHFFILPPSFLVTVYKRFIRAIIFGRIKIERPCVIRSSKKPSMRRKLMSIQS